MLPRHLFPMIVITNLIVIALYFRSGYIFVVVQRRSLVGRRGASSIKTAVRKSRRVSLEKFLPENSSWIYARVDLLANTFSRILSTSSREVFLGPTSSAPYESSQLPRVPEVIYPTALIVPFVPARSPAGFLALANLAVSRELTRATAIRMRE